MRPIGGPAPSYRPPLNDVEPPATTPSTQGKAGGHPAEPSRSSPAPSGPPLLGNAQRFKAGRYAHLGEAIINMQVSGGEVDARESRSSTRRSERRAGPSSSAVTSNPNVASTSRPISAQADGRFVAADLAELASWSETTHGYSMDPQKAYGMSTKQKLPPTLVADMLARAQQSLEEGLEGSGVALPDVVTSQNRNHIHLNLNHIEMKHYLGKGANTWMVEDHNGIERKLLTKTDLYFADFHSQDVSPLAPLAPLHKKDSLGVMRELLRDAPGLVIGEAHSSVSSKRELIKNMKALKADGVTTLYMEHLCADSHGKALQQYMNSPKGSPMPARLKAYLDMQTRGNQPFGRVSSEYDFAKLIEAAKKAGLQVIPIDTAETYVTSKEPSITRIKVMNYYAAEKIRLTAPEGKWIAFVGSAHATTFKGVPGLAQIHQVRSLMIDDHGTSTRPEIGTNVKDYGGELNPDAVLSYKR